MYLCLFVYVEHKGNNQVITTVYQN